MATGFKSGGRAKGSLNKVTKANRVLLQSILETELNSGRIQKELEKLEGKDYLNFVLKLASLALPKNKVVDPNVEEPTEYIPPPMVIIPASLDERTAKMHLQELEDKFIELYNQYFPGEEPPD